MDDTSFDPASPYAFQPPDYSLPKDPPKYCDIASATGIDNAGFTTTATTTPPADDESTSQPTPTATATDASTPRDVSVVVVTSEQGSTGASGAPTGRAAVMETPPPVYEAVETHRDAAVTSAGAGASQVRVDRDSEQPHISVSRHLSVTSHGAESPTNSMTSVDSDLPPPYVQESTPAGGAPAVTPAATPSTTLILST